jgi:transketolase
MQRMINSIELARQGRISVLEMISKSKASHIGSSLSVIDILATIYAYKINNKRESDNVLLSKGHAAAALYAILGNCDYFPKEKLLTYCEDGSTLGGHVTRFGNAGVEFSTGSLGHAFSFGIGKALAKLSAEPKSKIFVVLSDGECDEGSTWEAALLGSHHNLSNLIVLIDRNGLQSLTTTELTLGLEPLDKKWKSFGWNVVTVDGHDHTELLREISEPMEKNFKPKVLICETVKGKGISFMENRIEWHYKSPSALEFSQALTELEGM